MKETLALILFTVIPPIIVMITWWFICWEVDWTTELRGVMVLVGLLGFFAGISCINEVIHGQ